MTRNNKGFDPYVPRIASSWDQQAPGHLGQSIEGTLVFVDVSGFTALSERLAQKGRIGAEELTSVLDRIFGRMLKVVYQRGGSLLKFGGDALLLFFSTEDHVLQATASTVEMRAMLRDASKEPTSVGRIELKMSSGIHTGAVDFFLVGGSHLELLIVGNTATVTTAMEATADAGEIVVSDEIKSALPSDFIKEPRGPGWLLRKRKINHAPCGPTDAVQPEKGAIATLVPTGLRDHLASGLDDSEHRIASVAFVGFGGTDRLIRAEGPEHAADVLAGLIGGVQEAADDEGVTFLATDVAADGGKIILASGVPSSRHDDEGRVLRAARRVLGIDSELSIRIGVNRGHVFSGSVGTEFRRTYTVMGDTVNLAARLMTAAASGGLYASPSVLNLSSTLYRTEPLQPFFVKGKARPVQAFAVFDDIGVRPPETATELPFRGREAELEMLVGIVNTCSRIGRGGIMTITGDTGVGKSRLIAEVLERCGGMDILSVQAEPSGIDNPYWAFRDPLRRFFGIERGSHEAMARALTEAVAKRAPELEWALSLIGDLVHIEVPDSPRTADIDPRFRPERTADVLVDLLSTSITRPVALTAEDGQWLDEASLNLLKRIGTAAEERPWTVLVTARNTESDFDALGDEISLRPLSDDAIREIAIEMTQATPLRPHELDAIVSKADGNPLFVEEILRVVAETGSAEELPDSLDAVISNEIDTLPLLPRQLLRYSSVLGRRFRRVVLEEFLANEVLEFDDATSKALGGFIDDEGEGRLAFRHGVVHDIAYRSLPYAKRRELHSRAGDIIENQAADDPESVAEYLSTHYSLSGEYEKAWKYSRIAADKAKQAYANSEAAAHYKRAIEAARASGVGDSAAMAELWMNVAEVRELSGQVEDARAALAEALAQSRTDPGMLSDVYLRLAGAWLNSGNTTQAKRNVTLGRKALRNGNTSDFEPRHARLDAFDASVHATSGELARAADLANAAIERATRLGEDEALARAYSALDYALFVTQDAEPRYGEAAIEIYERLGFLERSVVVMNNLGAMAYWQGRWSEAADWYGRAVDAAERSGNVLDAALTRANIAEVLVGQRRPKEAESLLSEARRVFRSANSHEFMPLVELLEARVDLCEGRVDEALEKLEKLVKDQLDGRPTAWTEETVIALADALARGGRAAESLALLDEPSHFAGASESDLARIRGLALARSGEREQARSDLERAAALAADAGEQYSELLAREALADLREQTGEASNPSELARRDELKDGLGVTSPSLL